MYDAAQNAAVPLSEGEAIPRPTGLAQIADVDDDALLSHESYDSSGAAAAVARPNAFYVERLNNRKRFPYNDGVFACVVMRKGLCKCHETESGCGGLHGDPSYGVEFLLEVARVLSREQGACAFLHGVPKHTSRTLWSSIAQTVYEHFQGLLHIGLAIDSKQLMSGIKMQWSSRASLAHPSRPLADPDDAERRILRRAARARHRDDGAVPDQQ